MAAQRINQQQLFKSSFARAFADSTGQASPWRIQHAIASYIRSLSPFSSRFDRYMQGEHTLLNVDEKQGFNLFMGKAKCGACHFAPIFNGTAGPLFQKTEAEVLGVPAKPDTAHATIDPDPGRYGLNPYPQWRFAFKTPTVRNIAQTAPYMHNGVYKTLEEVLDFYNRGGGHGMGIELNNQTLAPDPLNLSRKEMQSIIAFLKTLTDD
jgi:cytochrome c peroxidase